MLNDKDIRRLILSDYENNFLLKCFTCSEKLVGIEEVSIEN